MIRGKNRNRMSKAKGERSDQKRISKEDQKRRSKEKITFPVQQYPIFAS